jgi:uncharacterized protein
MQVINQTQQKVLVKQGRWARSFWTRLKGLMGVRKLPAGTGLWLEPANSVHTCFMRLPIDVVYINRAGEVIDLDPDMAPWRFGRLRWGSRAVLELPAGAIAKMGLAVGDRLQAKE